MAPQPEWFGDALCAGVDPDLWFPENGGYAIPAKQICRGCTVREPCLELALRDPVERFGVWGGMSERERRKIQRKREA